MPSSTSRALLLLLGLLPACRATPPSQLVVDARLDRGNGIQLAYRTTGNGPDTVVVIPGGPGLDARYLESALAPLTAHHVLVFYDPRGRGRSGAIADSLNLSFSADLEDLEALRTQLKLSHFSLLAHHWGAILATAYAEAHPTDVQRLLLLSPFFPRNSFLFSATTLPNDTLLTRKYLTAVGEGRDTLDPQGFCRQYWGFSFVPLEVTDDDLVRRMAPDMCAAPSAVLRQRDLIQRVVRRSQGGVNLEAALHTLSMPILVIQGVDHPFVLSAAKAWAEWSPNGRIIVGPGPGLFPWIDKTGAFSRQATQFLDGQWPVEAARGDSTAIAIGDSSAARSSSRLP